MLRCVRAVAFPAVLVVPFFLPAWAAADELTGAQVYRGMCARCHGAEGEGTKTEYPQPLAGKKSVEQLTKYIAKSMPEDDPGKLKGPDAEKVAAYIYENFYSPDAQARQKPPRLELAHLTVHQYRNAIADLVASFRPAPAIPEGSGTGLRGEYFKGKLRGKQKGGSAFTRVDPVIQIDLGPTSPDLKHLDADEFSVRWQGSLLAPDTGDYEFLIRTDQSGQLWLNDAKQPLIDASVKSGADTEYRASIYLLAGRLYPLRLEFFRSTLGVQKKDKVKTPPPPASISLEWKRPRRALEVIAQRFLYAVDSAPAMVVHAPFPPDDRSAGYERGSAVSKAWVDATTEGAIETAGFIAANLSELAGAGGENRNKRLRDFAGLFAERAFRRPLSDEQQRIYVDHHFEASADSEAAVKRSVLLTLKSPWFLYRELADASASRAEFDVASRLAFNIWDSVPDVALWTAAESGKLRTRAEVAREAERMLKDPRARAKINDFFLLWLKAEPAGDLAKDRQRFPGFDQAVASDLRTSLELFLDDVVWSEGADFRRLFLDNHLYLNGRLSAFFGPELLENSRFEKVACDPNERFGVLTHPYVMATLAYSKESSPIHRGVFMARSVLGLPLRPPAEAFTPLPAELHPNLTTRERVSLQTKAQACQSCHGVVNPLGFVFEHYDAIGAFRLKENGRPVDATGSYRTRDGKLVTFSGIRDLSQFLADSEEVQEAFVAQFFHHLVRQPIRAYGVGKLEEVRKFFAANNLSIKRLTVEIITQTALIGRDEKIRTTNAASSP